MQAYRPLGLNRDQDVSEEEEEEEDDDDEDEEVEDEEEEEEDELEQIDGDAQARRVYSNPRHGGNMNQADVEDNGEADVMVDEEQY